jgi:hypothetical protein
MAGANGALHRGLWYYGYQKNIINAINVISNNHVVPCADDYIMYWDIWTAGDIFFHSFIK